MDFSQSEEQQAIQDLAGQIIGARANDETLKDFDYFDRAIDRELWRELAEANLLGIAIPEAHGGSGMGMLELCGLLEEQGRHLAPVPLWATLTLAALPLAEFGTEAQKARYLGAVTSGDLILSAALGETGLLDPARPRTEAKREGSAWRIEGEKECVPAADLAERILVPANTDAGVRLFWVDPRASGVALERQDTVNHEPLFQVCLSGASAAEEDALGEADHGAEIVHWIEQRALVGLSALQLGVCAEALRRTAEYTSNRKQFGRAIGSYQGVSLRAADAYIAVEAIRSTLWQAAWRIDTGRPADQEVAAAKWWAAHAGHEVAHTCQHLHGGQGADTEYPIHRFFLWAKQIGMTLGGEGRQLQRLGRIIAEQGVRA